MPIRSAALLCGILTCSVVAGCSSSGSSADTSSSAGLSGKITVFAASSLTEAFNTLAGKFESAHPGTTVNFKYDASSTLATSITQGQPADVFASASTTTMASVSQATDPTNFVSNTMEIATPPGNPAKITSVEDLAKSSVKVALCDPAVPCGATAEQVFTNAKISVHPVSTEPDVKSTLAKVEIKEVDAGVVYVTDVRAAGDKVTGVTIDSDVNASTTYPISVLKDSANPSLAQAWVDYVLSSDGQQVLKADGFSAP